ncbi:phospholipase D active site motif protein [Lentinula detonsa]|uniref:Phospholipase D active site motif protein n=1 Tax=Lentinula detonsa TaxID=2804962 RepID=A0AA38PS76_9AGAR|nr:phospholipase D active site motif protein [Lentinula detonsa]
MIVEALLISILTALFFQQQQQRRRRPRALTTMTRPTIYDLVQSTTTISSEYARDPSEEPGKITKRLYSHVRETDESPPPNLGNFGSVPPSPLFLSIYHSILLNLAASGDVMAGMVSPPLIASSGVVPLTIVAPLPDIVKHMSNCIVRAKKEVFLATNFWINSDTSRIVTDAFRELSKRAGERGDKVVVKVLYDRGNVKQAFEHHQHVPLSTYTNDKVNLPPPEEIPNIHMEVVNYHVPLLGTFHSKFMVVDREVALLMSNNIQDNDNLEMCVRLEGPIVDSLYDVCLASWSTTLEPPLPCRDSPAMTKPLPSYTDPSFLALFTKDSTKEPVNLSSVAQAGHESLDLPEHLPGNPHYDTTIAGEIRRIQASYAPKPGETHLQAVSRHFNITKMQKADGGVQPTAPEPSSDSLVSSEEMTPYIPLPPSAFPGGEIGSPTPIPMLVASRAPLGTPTFSIPQAVKYPQNVAFLEAIRGAQKSVFIQTPNLNAEPLLPELVKAVRRGVQVEIWVCLGYNDAGELLPYQNGTNEMIANRLYNDPGLFTTTHQAHPSVPVVPNTKESMLTPNEAGDASQAAEPHRLNESDDLNSNANANANAQDVEAGSSELHPNDAQPLSEEEKSRLKIYNYVAKDQDKPIHNKFKKRSCHIKVLIIDSHLAIQGNGNQDTQTYFHSQEINVMLDSEEVCKRWMEGLRRNQNTEKYGLVSPLDGCWHDPKTGEMAEGAIGVDPGRFSWAKGVIGAVQRVRGAGGF